MENFKRNGSYGGGGQKFGGSRDGGGGRFGAGGGFDRPQLFKATCASCGNQCEVPFKPNGSKPVFCRDCFKKEGNDAAPRRFDRADSGRPPFAEKQMYSATCDTCGNACEVPFRPTGERPVFCRACFGKDRPPEHREQRSTGGGDQYAEQFRTLNAKLDALLKVLTPVKAMAPAAPAAAVKAAPAAKEIEAPKKVDKKKAPAKKKK